MHLFNSLPEGDVDLGLFVTRVPELVERVHLGGADSHEVVHVLQFPIDEAALRLVDFAQDIVAMRVALSKQRFLPVRWGVKLPLLEVELVQLPSEELDVVEVRGGGRVVLGSKIFCAL